MKAFFLSILKGLSYIMLYIAGQYIAVYVMTFYYSFQIALKDPTVLDTETSYLAFMEAVMEQLEASTSLQLLITIAVVFLILLVFFHARGKHLIEEVWAMPVRITSLWPVVVLGGSLALVICYGITMIPWPESAIEAYNTLYSASNDESVLTFIVTVLIAPILEELIFRGLAFTRFCRGMPATAALMLSACIFGIMHGTLIWMVYAILGGVAMTLVYMKYRSLYAAILLHMVFNLVGGYLILLLVTPSPIYDLLIFGASVAVTALMGLIIYRMPRSRIDRLPKKQTQPPVL